MNRNVDINFVISKNAPVLFLDTCILLDIIRDVTRDSITKGNTKACLDLLSKAENNNEIFVLIAPQVHSELLENESSVKEDSMDSLKRFIDKIIKVDDILSEYGSTAKVSISHLNNYVCHAMNILNRWKKVAYLIPENDDVVKKAFARVTLSKAPARKGKDSIKDCVVTETYLDYAEELRKLGLTANIIFVSSNTKDYCDNKILCNDLESDFGKNKIIYSPNLGAAKYNLTR